MKNITIALLLSFITISANAKKVKFAVDMSGIAISPFGMHITGDFQTLAGFSGGDWMSNTTPLAQETADTNIYSIVVDIPAFAKYEYKFINGDQFYEAEFVPYESRVNYNFNDNRWLYIDSLSNDTTFVGAIKFGGNAPAGKKLIRFFVDMQNETLSSNGVHVAGDYQMWNTASDILYHFIDAPTGIYEIINYVDSSTYYYKFYNGNSSGNSETVPSGCNIGGNRSITTLNDTLLEIVCFSSCGICVTGINELAKSAVKIYPNPTTSFAQIEFNDNSYKTVVITDLNGKVVRTLSVSNSNILQIEKENLNAGIYFINVRYSDNSMSKAKLIFQ